MHCTKFSIIIPVYNSADDLIPCLDSILCQTYKGFELILVDDGSLDQSYEICERTAHEYSFVKTVRIRHAGAGAARNAGLKLAQGDFILFVDADDYWNDKYFLEKLSRVIDNYYSCQVPDILMFQIMKVTDDGKELKRYRKPMFRKADRVLSMKEAYRYLVQDGQMVASACNKCIRRHLLLKYDIRFPERVHAEDIDWVLQLFSHTRTIYLMNDAVYAYRQHHHVTASTDCTSPGDLVAMIDKWADKLQTEQLPNKRSVAGLIAFEYGIAMGYHHCLSDEMKAVMKKRRYLLRYGMDKKTKIIYRFYSVFGFFLTCLAIRFYLFCRRIW